MIGMGDMIMPAILVVSAQVYREARVFSLWQGLHFPRSAP